MAVPSGAGNGQDAAMAIESRVLTREGLDAVIGALRAEGRIVLGPVQANGAISHDEISSVDQLPTGWADEQAGGHYRVVRTDDGRLFAHASPSESWKRFLFPSRTLMVRAHRDNGSVRIEQPELDAPPVAFFGVRSCDLAALDVLDRVFLDPAATDPTYAARRRNVFIVAAACAEPGGTCFCASMGTGPTPRAGFDLAVSELRSGADIDYVVTAGTEAGTAILDQVEGRTAHEDDRSRARASHDAAVARMGRELDPADPPLAAQYPDHPQWGDVAQRCLACGNCTMVCPTCFCTTVEDVTDLTGQQAERWRKWDSCFNLDFSHITGGSVRSTPTARYRQWMIHKLATWQDQFGTSGCVGCGRCITWCPVGIDITEEVRAIRGIESARDPRYSRKETHDNHA